MAYGKVEETFWNDPVIRSLSESGRSLMLYLLTCPHKNRLGCFVLAPGYAAADMGWGEARVVEAIGELERAGRVSWDGDHRVVFVRRFAKHNTLENPQVVKGALADLRALPDSPLLGPLMDALSENRRAHYTPLLAALAQRLAQRFPQRLETPTPAMHPQPLAIPSARDGVTATDTVRVSEAVPAPEASLPKTHGPERLNGSSPDTGEAPDRSVEVDEGDALEGFVAEYPESSALLSRLKHPGGKTGTAASIRTRILYPDAKPDLADPALKGQPLPERTRLFAAALIEYAAKGGKEWDVRAIVGYMARLIRTRGEQDREEAHRREKANESQGSIRAIALEREQEDIRRLNEQAAAQGISGDPSSLVSRLVAKVSMPDVPNRIGGVG